VTATRQQAAGLAAVAAVGHAAHAADDSAALCTRICETLARSLGFDRVTLTRYFADDGRIELLAAHGPPLHDPIGWIGAAGWQLFRRAREGGSPVLAERRPGATTDGPAPRDAHDPCAELVVPLVAGTSCVGFLAAKHGNVRSACAGQHDLLATLGTIVAALLEKALAHDDLVNVLRLRGEFIALASHELRTPAAAVYGAAMTLHGRASTLTLPQQTDLLRLLHEQAERLQGLVAQLLDLSRLEARSVRIKPIALAVRERTEEIVHAVAAEGGRIDIRIDSGLRVAADPEAFDRIVSNLIANACRYGRPPITVSAAANDRHFRLAVEDRGQGVTREFAPKLFERFSRADGSVARGAGLGLSIAQAYAHAHGGRLAYTDARPHGARFELIVPLHPNRGEPPEPPGAEDFEAGQTVWLNGRAASFCYAAHPGSAVIRYDGERETRVVLLRKLVTAPPPATR
jgi:hypothetical protein